MWVPKNELTDVKALSNYLQVVFKTELQLIQSTFRCTSVILTQKYHMVLM